MYYILWTDENGVNHWETIDGEDAMQIRADELVKLGYETNDRAVTVFPDTAML